MKIIKSRIIFFAITLTYNLLLGLYLKDFLVLSQTLPAFYLLSVLPTFFLLIEPRATGRWEQIGNNVVITPNGESSAEQRTICLSEDGMGFFIGGRFFGR